MRLSLGLALIGLMLASTAGAASYDCPAAACDASPTCQCASVSPPGGPAPANTPQFVVLTNDDAVTAAALRAVLNITGRHANRNGCPMPATWFVCPEWNAEGWAPQRSDPALVRRLFLGGHELASHTLTHPRWPSAAEIVGARAWLNESAGVPLEAVRGFRAPYLSQDAAQRAILRHAGFLFDSSMTTQWGPGQPSPSAAARVWPWTMDHGAAPWAPDERQPGLWELPLWAVQDEAGGVLAWMDPGTTWGPEAPPEVDNAAAYRRMFEASYRGNRAPVGIFLHSQMLTRFPQHQAQLNAFLEWALAQPHVWAVTISELLRWMKDPVPAAQYELACDRRQQAAAALDALSSSAAVEQASAAVGRPPVPPPSLPMCCAAVLALLVAAACLALRRAPRPEGTASERLLLVK